jgi:hypothetical protein
MTLEASGVSRSPIYEGRMEVHIIVASLVTVLKGCNGIVSADWQWSAEDGRYEDSKVGSEEGSGCPQEGCAFSGGGVSGWPTRLVFVVAWARSVGDARAGAVPAPGNDHVQGLGVVKGRGSGCRNRHRLDRLREGSRDLEEEGNQTGGTHTLGQSCGFPRRGTEGEEGCGDEVRAYEERPSECGADKVLPLEHLH